MLNNDNYFSEKANKIYCGSSQYKDFIGSKGIKGCEARAVAKLKGIWVEESSTAMLVGSYVDSWFEGTIEHFRENHPQLFKKNGELLATYKQAEDIIEFLKKDKLFMQFMSGDKQTIMTGNIEGLEYKIKIDSYLKDKAIVDLKVMRDFREKKWTLEGKVNFIEYWGYDIQAAIYQEIVRQNTGRQLPFFIAAVSKEAIPDKEIIWIPDELLAERLEEIKENSKLISDLKNGLRQPLRCESCDYCKSIKELTEPISIEEL